MAAFTKPFRRRLRRQDREAGNTASQPTPAAAAAPEQAPVEIAPNDPLLAYFQAASEAVDIEALELDSPALRELRAAGVKLAVPLVSQGELIGVLNLGPRLSEQDYSSDDRKLLDNLAAQAAPALRVGQLVREQEAEAVTRQRFESELEVARLIQQNFLPKELPEMAGWQVAAYWRTGGGEPKGSPLHSRPACTRWARTPAAETWPPKCRALRAQVGGHRLRSGRGPQPRGGSDAPTSTDRPGRSLVAQLLDLGAERGLGVEPLARDAGAAGDRLEADRCAVGVEFAQRLLGAERSPRPEAVAAMRARGPAAPAPTRPRRRHSRSRAARRTRWSVIQRMARPGRSRSPSRKARPSTPGSTATTSRS